MRHLLAVFAHPNGGPRDDRPIQKKILIIAASVAGAFAFTMLCGTCGIIGIVNKDRKPAELAHAKARSNRQSKATNPNRKSSIAQVPDAAKKEFGEPDKNKTKTKQGDLPNKKELGDKPVKKEEAVEPLAKEIVEWKEGNGNGLYSEKPIPILFGVPKSVITQMPADQQALIETIEKLGDEANKAIKEEGDNPVLKNRLIKNIERKSAEITDEFVTPTQLKSKLKTPSGWGGQNHAGAGDHDQHRQRNKRQPV